MKLQVQVGQWAWGRDISVGIATRPWLDGLRIGSRWKQVFPHPFNRPPVKCVSLILPGRQDGLHLEYLMDRGSRVVKVLCYKPESRWFDPTWCHWKFSLTQNPSDRTLALRSTQPLTEMSTRSISWGGKGGRCVSLTTLPPSCAVYT